MPHAPDATEALPTGAPFYIGSEIYRFSTYGPTHPLAVPRVSTCTDLIRAMGWLDERQFVTAPMASVAQITRFHDPAYVAALQRAERDQAVGEADRRLFRIGTDGNPVFAEIFSRPATSAGGVMLGARLALEGCCVHCPGGGTHHGRRDRASGFCYLNDPVLGLLTWLDAGLSRVAYLDIDAHHGDGVQDAFADDDRVLTVSIHEAGRWPGSGHMHDRAGGMARNLPVPPGFNDSEMGWLMQRAVLPLLRAYEPQAILLQTGADALEEDPLARLSLSNNAYFEVARAVRALRLPLLVVGGGGYNPYATGRCWAGIWATLNDLPIPPRTTPAAERVLRALTYNRAAGRNPPEHWFTTIRDAPREGPVSDPVRRVADLTLETLHDHPPPAAGQPAAGARDRPGHGAGPADRAAARTAPAEAGDRHP